MKNMPYMLSHTIQQAFSRTGRFISDVIMKYKDLCCNYTYINTYIFMPTIDAFYLVKKNKERIPNNQTHLRAKEHMKNLSYRALWLLYQCINIMITLVLLILHIPCIILCLPILLIESILCISEHLTPSQATHKRWEEMDKQPNFLCIFSYYATFLWNALATYPKNTSTTSYAASSDVKRDNPINNAPKKPQDWTKAKGFKLGTH